MYINDYINFIDVIIKIESPTEAEVEEREGLAF